MDKQFEQILEDFVKSSKSVQISEQKKIGSIQNNDHQLDMTEYEQNDKSTKPKYLNLSNLLDVATHYHVKEVSASVVATFALDFVKFLSEQNFDFNKVTTYANNNPVSNAIFAIFAWFMSYCMIRLRFRPITFFEKIIEKTSTK